MLSYFKCVGGRIEHVTEFRPEHIRDGVDALHWIDLEDPTVKEATILEDPFHFHPLAIEDCLSEVHHPKVDDYEGYLFLIVHGIRFDAPTDQFITRELDVFLGANYLITHHRGPMRSITAAREQCGKNLQAAMPKGVDFLMHQILDQMFEHYFPNLDAIEDKIQLVQVEVFESPTRETLDRIFVLKRDAMQLRRICTPQREIVHRLSRGEFRVISPKAAIYFRDIYDNLYRIVDASFAYQDMIQGTLDAYLTAVSNRLNETMKRLTVIGAVFAALTVLTGVYGMNFENMPELRWRYGYLMVWVLMGGITAGLVWYFKRKEWI
ncbi:MAG TPA: magnesium/cobalt transporter CorA [Vicinamibacteria bacterium]|nr:magnesium/cobalt transporter CorA [Vicinamibacteria bacterium]